MLIELCYRAGYKPSDNDPAKGPGNEPGKASESRPMDGEYRTLYLSPDALAVEREILERNRVDSFSELLEKALVTLVVPCPDNYPRPNGVDIDISLKFQEAARSTRRMLRDICRLHTCVATLKN